MSHWEFSKNELPKIEKHIQVSRKNLQVNKNMDSRQKKSIENCFGNVYQVFYHKRKNVFFHFWKFFLLKILNVTYVTLDDPMSH